MTKAPVAFVLVRFKDSVEEPLSVADARKRFTDAGRGQMFMFDWIDENTHGNVDMTGSQVFGWYSLDVTVDEYRQRRADGTYPRVEIVELGRNAAVANAVDLSSFVVTVIVTNIEVDFFGWPGGRAAVCTASTAGKAFWESQTAPAALCQELIHGLGIADHSRRAGSDQDYQDPYDVMSMFSAYTGRHPSDASLPIGPGLNAAFMQRCGWLDPGRGTSLGPATLRPLHRRDLSGHLYANVGDYFVEYRKSERWDRGFKESIVLVHTIANNTSFLMAELREGDRFTFGYELGPAASRGHVEVISIDDATDSATINSELEPTRVAGPVWSLFGTELVGGDGVVVLLGGRIIRIPPRSPELAIIQSAVRMLAIEDAQLPAAIATQARASVVSAMIETLSEQHEHLVGPSSMLTELSHATLQYFHAERAQVDLGKE